MIKPNNSLRIDRLRLENFRCFAACDLSLHPKLTVLVADNAQGKTALLDALRISLQEFVTTVGRGKQPRGFDRTDILLKRGEAGAMGSRLPTKFKVDGLADGELVSWSRVLSKDSFHARTSTKDTRDIRRIGKRLADRPGVHNNHPSDSPTVLPVVAYYGTGRLYDEHRLTEGKRWLAETSPIRSAAYLDCLSPSSSYKSFAAWFGQEWEQVSDPRFRAVGFQARPENYIAAVRDAVRTVLGPTGWTTIVWEPARHDPDGRNHSPGYIALEHSEKGRLPLSHLSDGVRNMVALVGDLAHRCVRLNPFLGEEAAKQTPGIVLIDEVEMHLHPRWQQLVIGLLSAAFPCVQFVMSTHSPQVLTTVKRENIRILAQDADGTGSADMPDEETKGVESSTTMNDVMGVNQVPPVPEAGWRDDYTALIENGGHDTKDGKELRAKLAALYGNQHPIILDFDRLIRFQAFKRRKTPPSE
jgi:predicted ATP-binding protein involved in virulence